MTRVTLDVGVQNLQDERIARAKRRHGAFLPSPPFDCGTGPIVIMSQTPPYLLPSPFPLTPGNRVGNPPPFFSSNLKEGLFVICDHEGGRRIERNVCERCLVVDPPFYFPDRKGLDSPLV